ncbi:MAG: hypothetical protein ACRBCL_11205 [Maritimibacter sp.]
MGLWFVILKRSFAEVYNGLWGLLRGEWVVLLVFAALGGVWPYVDGSEVQGRLISFGMLVWISWSWHRAAAADGTRPKALKPVPLIKYTLDFFLMGLVAVVPVLLLSTVIQGVIEYIQAVQFDYVIEGSFDPGAANEIMSNFQYPTRGQLVLSYLPIIATALVAPWVALRISLVLPTRARGQDMGFRESWRATKPLTWQIWFLGVAANLIYMSIGLGAFFAAYNWGGISLVVFDLVIVFLFEVLSAVWIASLVLQLDREVEARA